MSDIFNEVDDALRREKAAHFWKTYGSLVILAALLLILGTGIATAYTAWNSAHNQEETGKLVAATDEKDMAAAMEKAAQETKEGHRGVALLNAAAKYSDKKDFAKAAALYDTVSKDASVPQDLRDLANIFYTRAAILSAKEAPDYKTLAARVLPAAENAGSSFQQQAKLEAALLYGNGLRDYKKALELLKGFDADSAGDSLKEKANALQHVYEYELITSSKGQTDPAPKE